MVQNYSAPNTRTCEWRKQITLFISGKRTKRTFKNLGTPLWRTHDEFCYLQFAWGFIVGTFLYYHGKPLLGDGSRGREFYPLKWEKFGKMALSTQILDVWAKQQVINFSTSVPKMVLWICPYQYFIAAPFTIHRLSKSWRFYQNIRNF